MISRRLFSTVKSAGNVTKLPRLAVFDLDHTIWGFGVDTFCYTPPFHYNSNGQVIDMSAKVIEHFPDIGGIFDHLHQNGVKIAVASRTKYPYGAYSLLDKLGLRPKIDLFEIYPGDKIKHFQRIRQQSGVDFPDMIFFDDEERNIVDVGVLGVFSVLVDHDEGVTRKAFDKALQDFHDRV